MTPKKIDLRDYMSVKEFLEFSKWLKEYHNVLTYMAINRYHNYDIETIEHLIKNCTFNADIHYERLFLAIYDFCKECNGKFSNYEALAYNILQYAL